jgi:hypothetical protein
MRDGVPLPGTTPAAVLSQLAHRVFGPLRPDRVRVMLDFHGLAGQPATSRAAVADRHHISPTTVTTWAAALAAAGGRLPVTDDLAAQVGRPSTAGEDHLGRTRAAATLGVPPPDPPVPPARPAGSSQTDRRVAGIAVRVLAAAGPQTLDTVQAAITRSRRDRPAPTDADLAAALRTLGAAPDETGRWRPPPGRVVSVRDQTLCHQVAGRTLTRSAMIAALVQAGYTYSYADGRAINTHPLIRRVAPNNYRLINDHAPAPA